MAVTVRQPRDERPGELGAGLGILFGNLLRRDREKKQQETQQEAFLGMAGAANKAEYIRAAAPLATSPQMALQIQKRADEKFTTKLQEYEITLQAADGTFREKVKWMDQPNLSTIDLKDRVNSVMGTQGMSFAFGTPKTAPARVEPGTGRVLSPTTGIRAGEFADIERGKAAAKTAAQTGAKLTQQDQDAQDILNQRGFPITDQNMTRARQVNKHRGFLAKNLTNIFAEKFGADWASFGENSGKFTQAMQIASDLVFAGRTPEQALAVASAAVKRDLGDQPSTAEDEAARKAIEEKAPGDLGEDIGGIFQSIRGFFGGGAEEPQQPAAAAEQPTGTEQKLVPLGSKDGEVVFIPDSITTATEAVNYLVGQGWTWEDARSFVLSQEGK